MLGDTQTQEVFDRCWCRRCGYQAYICGMPANDTRTHGSHGCGDSECPHRRPCPECSVQTNEEQAP